MADPTGTPTVAVVCAAYNASRTITSTLLSVYNQSVSPDEVIVVDDGSDDDTADVAGNNLAKPDVLRIPNSGPSTARNIGSNQATSDYIMYLDSDDLWQPRKVEFFCEVIKALDNPGMIVSDFTRQCLDTGRQFEKTSADIFSWIRQWPAKDNVISGFNVREFSPAMAVEAILKGFPIYPSALAISRDHLNAIGGWHKFKRAQDFDVALRLAPNTGLVFIDQPLSVIQVYEKHGDEYAYIARQHEWDLKVLDYHIESNGLGAKYSKTIRRYRALRTIFRGDLSLAYQHYLNAVHWYIRSLLYPSQYLRAIHRIFKVLYSMLSTKG